MKLQAMDVVWSRYPENIFRNTSKSGCKIFGI
jgi:hypothetical protein